MRRALGELHRAPRPGGELRFFEHGRAPGTLMATTQLVLDRTVWPPLFGGCHVARSPVDALGDAGFEVGPYRRFLVPARGPRLPTSYCVLGTARRPEPS
ncbi:Class I SAM-dependent methyltransferase OS=Streptomyces alboniger OX=132473 GN=CP975_01850 PE=4 SV=1 [Streptomyces alboniger]